MLRGIRGTDVANDKLDASSNLQRSVVIFPETEVDGREVAAAAHLVTNASVGRSRPLEKVNDLIIAQAGLPGNWRSAALAKARALVSANAGAAVMVPFSAGLVLEPDIVGVQNKRDLMQLHALYSGFFEKLFSFADYLREMFVIYKHVRGMVRDNCRIHLVGQSYGANGLLLALKEILKQGLPMPASANFWAPFVKVLMEDDPEIGLSIVNREVSDVLNGVEDDEVFSVQMRELLGLFDTFGRFFGEEVTRDYLRGDHAHNFSRERIEDSLSGLRDIARQTRVSILGGGGDPYVGSSHLRLVAETVGVGDYEVLPESGHDLESASFSGVIAFGK